MSHTHDLVSARYELGLAGNQFHNLTETLVLGGLAAQEHWLEAKIQPKPRWLPTWLWRRVLARLLVVVEYHGHPPELPEETT